MLCQDSVGNPIWHLDRERALFAGPLGHNASHRHSVAVYLAGLYGGFALRMGGSEWLDCRTAVIPAGLDYEFDMRGEPLAVLYLEPGSAHAEQLASLMRNRREVGGGLVGSAGEIALLRDVYEDRDSAAWIGHALDDLIGFARREPCGIDPRILRVVDALHESYADIRRVISAAESIGLSASRFQHVFTQQVGVPFRRYRAWCRMRTAIREVVRGSNLTAASHAAGFADQAHFSRQFRHTGAPATPSLAKVRAMAAP